LALQRLQSAAGQFACEVGVALIARGIGVRQVNRRFAAQPTDNGNAAVAKDHQRLVRVAHNPGQLCLQDLIQQIDHRFFIDFLLCHNRIVNRPVTVLQSPDSRLGIFNHGLRQGNSMDARPFLPTLAVEMFRVFRRTAYRLSRSGGRHKACLNSP
jgi:hypothetical protein